MIKTVVSIITVILSILQTILDEFRVFNSGSVLPILGSILQFCIHNLAWGSLLPRHHFCGRTSLPYSYYCPLVSYFTTYKQLQKMEKIQERALRFITDDCVLSYEILLINAGFATMRALKAYAKSLY